MELNVQTICTHLDSQGVAYGPSDKESELITYHKLGSFDVAIRAEIPTTFPCDLPCFHLIDRMKYGALAHVAWSDGDYADICYGRNNNLSVDFHDPGKVFVTALGRALDILEKSLNDKEYNERELLREFAGVWRFHVKSANSLVCITEPSENSILLSIKSPIKRSKGTINRSAYAVDSESSCNENNYFLRRSRDKERNFEGKGISIPISHLLAPPAPDENIKDWWTRQLNCLSDERKRELKKNLKKSNTREFYILCHAKNDQDTIWFAIHCRSDTKQYAPITVETIPGWNFEAIHINVIASELLIPRGGGSTDLGSVKICIVGCGSVGGYIADMLASSGVGSLTLIDNDKFEPENLHRHLLDPSFLFWNKAQALKMKLVDTYPFVNIDFLNDNFLSLNKIDFWESFDAVILVIGAASHERKFNEFLRDENIKTPVVTTWVEPYGIGGHAIAVIPGEKGCLACAYIDNESDLPDLYPNLSFVERNQYVLESLGGCGTEFLAFSSIDAMQTATMASKLCIQAIKGDITKGTAVSWKSDSKLAKEKGILFTHRYFRMKSDLYKTEIAQESCSVCAGS